MRKALLTKLLLFIPFISFSQNFNGFISDNYSGIQGILSNPAHAAATPYLLDVNLLSSNAFGGNDYAGINLGALISNTKGDFYDASGENTTPTDANNFTLDASLVGPSFLFNINEKNALMLSSRLRTFTNISDVNGSLFDNYSNGFSTGTDYSFSQDNLFATTNTWAEIGISYATVLKKKTTSSLRSGISIKYLKGLGAISAGMKGLQTDYDSDSDMLNTAGEISYAISENYNKDLYITVPDSKGVSFDIGLIYEWKPVKEEESTKKEVKEYNNYKYKIGVSITDFGSISYPNSIGKTYDANRSNIDANTIDTDQDLEVILDNLYSFQERTEDLKIKLPAAAHISFDWNTNNKFYLNLTTDISMVGNAELSNKIVSTATLTPRFETKWLAAYSPISYNEYANFNWGLGFRAGPIFVGSTSLISNLFSKYSKEANVYFGLKLPIFKAAPSKKPTQTNTEVDTDRDGTIDSEDACIRIAGPKENKGCPWEDSDKDGILDDVDKCPNVIGDKNNEGCPWNDSDGDGITNNKDNCPNIAGPNENQGCPWTDTDKDGLIDTMDKCPNIAGPNENNGCPWSDTDGDGILDLKDKCPNVVGILELEGCPKPKVEKEVLDQLNAYARTILFNTGKATFRKEAYVTLNAIYRIMVEYKDATFIIEGHTDNTGTPQENQTLSELRANAVADFIMVRGVHANRIKAIGYGETKPISSNDTEKGRALNRRVVIKVN